jgi:basic amino acid/polyamine antiporter, APA family
MTDSQQNRIPISPKRSLNTFDIVSLIVGTILGAGVFRVPSMVAGQLQNEYLIIFAWLLGGAISMIGALCYAELATSYPSVGGEYSFLQKAYGPKLAFLYGWARSIVIVTGSLGILGITLGDYMTNIIHLGTNSSTLWAMIVISGLSILNAIGIKEGKTAQNILTLIEIGGVVAIIVTGLMVGGPPSQDIQTVHQSPSLGAASLAIIFVLLTYGGWNEAAYVSAEAVDQRRGIFKALILGIGTVTLLYLLVNIALLHTFGSQKMGQSSAIASDLFDLAYGRNSAILFSAIVVFSCLNSINATIIFGSRSSFALGQDWKLFSWVGHWDSSGAPRKAIFIQCLIALLLVFCASFSRKSFESVVEFTAPVFWFFILLIGIALFILRKKNPQQVISCPVPFYPVLPIIFVITVAWLLWSSLAYSGWGALFGVGCLAVGVVILFFESRIQNR